MSHANAALTPIQRLRLGKLIVDQQVPIAQAAQLFMVSWPTAKRWADRYRAQLEASSGSVRPADLQDPQTACVYRSDWVLCGGVPSACGTSRKRRGTRSLPGSPAAKASTADSARWTLPRAVCARSADRDAREGPAPRGGLGACLRVRCCRSAPLRRGAKRTWSVYENSTLGSRGVRPASRRPDAGLTPSGVAAVSGHRSPRGWCCVSGRRWGGGGRYEGLGVSSFRRAVLGASSPMTVGCRQSVRTRPAGW